MTETATDYETESTELKKPVKEVLVVQGQATFQHDTGDIYDGNFEIKKKDKIAKMHGPGTYTTNEGDIYIGNWEADKLGAGEYVSITYHDSSRYEGSFKDWSYNGRGRYIYPDGSILKCDFTDNYPVGNMELTDPNGHTWLGKAEQGFGWFQPVNHFYEMLEKTREAGKRRRRRKTGNDEKTT